MTPSSVTPAAPSPSTADRIAWTVLAIAGALSAALILLETRGNTFFNDEFAVLAHLGGGFDLEAMLTPHNGHLVGVAYLVYEVVLEVFGADPAVFRVIGVLALVACSTLVFIYLRRRIDPLLALAPAVVLLFLGASWETLLWPFSVATWGFAVLAGIGALLALEREDRAGDIWACVLLVVAVASHSTGLAFLVGAAVYIGLRGDRWPRAWVVVVPLALYAVWWLWALKFDQDSPLAAENLWLIPSFAADSLAAVAAAVTGLAANLGAESPNATIQIEPGWGRALGLVAIALVAVRVVRGNVPRALWTTLALLLAFWASLALGFGPGRTPDQSRYIYPGAVLLFLVAGAALTGYRVPRAGVIAALVVAALATMTGIRQLHDGQLFLDDYSQRVRAQLAMIEIGGDAIPPEFDPHTRPDLAEVVPPQLPLQAGSYLAAAERFGALGFDTPELLEQSAPVREGADRVLASALALGLVAAPTDGGGSATCTAAGDVTELQPGTVELRSEAPATLALGRFSDGFPVELGDLDPAQPVILEIPQDRDSRPWRLSVTGAAPVEICAA